MSSIWGNKWKVRKIYVFDKNEKFKFHKFKNNNMQYFSHYNYFKRDTVLMQNKMFIATSFNAKLATAHNKIYS